MIDFQHIERRIAKANTYDVETFDNSGNSFTDFLLRLEVQRFRHLNALTINFVHPVTIISGTNKVGKTSVLLLLACSHENFIRLDASKPVPTLRAHIWKDVMAFTKYENESNDYAYKIKWRVAKKINSGEGKRLASSQAWSGLGKKAKDRINAKIKKREVRLVDLDRLLPARSFSTSLLRKLVTSTSTQISDDVVKAFCYVLELGYSSSFKIHEVSSHVNKRCYVVDNGTGPYSSYNSATGEESLINILRESIESPSGSLILIDELEAGLHPSVQRRLAKVLHFIAWEHKKQFVITTHSATIIDAFPPPSRRFLESVGGVYKVINGITPQAALSKMDAVGHPLITLYCEDMLAKFLIEKVAIEITKSHPAFSKLIDVLPSGAASDVKLDFIRHKFRYGKVRGNLGFCAVLDGDMINVAEFSALISDENVHFIFPNTAPEKFLVKSYLTVNPNTQLSVFLDNDNHHALFRKMVDLGLGVDESDARNQCFAAFEKSSDYEIFFNGLRDFLMGAVSRFSDPVYTPT